MLDPTWHRSQTVDDWPNGLLDGLGYGFTPPDVLEGERGDLTESVLRRRLGAAVRRLNDPLDDLEVERAIRPLTGVPAATLMEANELVQRALLGKVRLIDFDEPDNNEFTFTRHWQTRGSYETISSDVVVFVNGIPLVVV
ncbi:MAG TPA: type I restriction endonuclease [Polyangiaceae bacterium]